MAGSSGACGNAFSGHGSPGGAGGSGKCGGSSECESAQPGTVCIDGTCGCPGASEAFCSDVNACVDTNTSPDHCGDCETTCSTPSHATAGCIDGGCAVGTCEEGFADCDEIVTNGCEVDATSDLEHCGKCDVSCAIACKSSSCNDALQVATGAGFTCALRTDGSVYCWGDNTWGNLGSGVMGEGSLSPVLVPIPPAKQIAVGRSGSRKHACALLRTGDVTCWGANGNGQLGNGNTTSSTTPVATLVVSDVTQIALGGTHTCALRDAKVYCWGGNNAGQVSIEPGDHTAPQPVDGLEDVVEIAAGDMHTCARVSGGIVYCWGANAYGQLGNGLIVGTPQPTQVADLDHARGIALGTQYSCAVQGDQKKLFCWGKNDAWQLGANGGADAHTPVDVGLVGVSFIALGTKHSSAVAGGKVQMWGANGAEQLGDGSNVDAHQPKDIGLQGISTGAGDVHSCAVTEKGALLCWGANSGGQLGDGTTEGHATPAEVVWP